MLRRKLPGRLLPPGGSGAECRDLWGVPLPLPAQRRRRYAVPANGLLIAGTRSRPAGTDGGRGTAIQPGLPGRLRHALNECGSIFAEYTDYWSSASDSITATAPLVLIPMVLNPSSLNAGAVWLSANASEKTSFEVADLGYRYNLWCCGQNAVNLLGGIRYGHLSQQFEAEYSNIISETVDSGVTFDCAGLRVGIDGDWCLGKGFFIHGLAAAAFVGGDFNANYLDTQTAAASTLIATTSWHEAHFASIVDGELAIGWQNCSGRIRLMAGYSINDWASVVKPSDFIAGVQANNYRSANQVAQTALVFDGVMTRAEVRW